MKTSRLAHDLRRISTIAIAAAGVLVLSTTAWGQTAESPKPAEAAPAASAPAAQPEAATAPAGEAQAEPAAPAAPAPQAIPPPPTSNRAEPGYGPPPGVPYHYYYGQPGYARYPVAPARPLTYRPFMFGVGLGIGSLSYSASEMSKHEPALAYAVQLGFSITSRWMALLSMDGSWGQFSFNDQEVLYPGKRSVAVSNFTAGVQFFILRSLYARVGLGVACLEWSDGYDDYSDCYGQAASGGLGYEFLQTHSTAVAVELGGFVSRFPDARTVDDRNDIWYHIGANMVLRLF